MVASRPTVMAPPRTSAAPRAFLAQWRARPHRRLVGVSVVCVESHEGRRIRAREAHQRLHAAFRDLDTDGALVTRTWAPAIDPEPVVTSVLNPPREGRASGRTLGTRGGPKSPNGAVYFHALFTRFRVYEPSFRESKAFKIVLFEKTLSFLGFNFPPVWDHRLTSAPPLPRTGTGFVDRTKLCVALEHYGLPHGEDYVDELMAQYQCDELGVMTFRDYLQYASAREQNTRRAWSAVVGTAKHRGGGSKFDWLLGNHQIQRHTSKDDDRNVRADSDDVLRAARAAGIDGVSALDASRMVSLLNAQSDPNGTVGYEDFRRYAAMLPSAQLRSGNAVWDWLVAAVPESRHGPPRGQRTKQLFAGGLAGIVGRTAVAPLDRARTIIQDMGLVRSPASSVLNKTGVMHTNKPPNAAQVCRQVLRNEGPAGLFRGNAVTALKVVPANALQFAIFHKMKDDFLRKRTDEHGKPAEQLLLNERLLSGAVAGALSTAACYPLDTLKSQMAVAGGLSGSVWSAGKQLFLTQGGVKGFYKGIGPTLLCDVIGSALGFTLYETFQTMYREYNGGRRPNPLEKGALGGLGACVSLTLTMPLEVVMTRMRVQGVGHRPVLYKNALECIKLSTQREGLKSLWLGTGAAYVKIFPQLAITYFVFELASEQLGVGGLGRYERSRPVRTEAADQGKPPGPVAA